MLRQHDLLALIIMLTLLFKFVHPAQFPIIKATPPSELPPERLYFVNAMKAYDLNHDGVIERNEIPWNNEALAADDRDGNGVVTGEELRLAGNPPSVRSFTLAQGPKFPPRS